LKPESRQLQAAAQKPANLKRLPWSRRLLQANAVSETNERMNAVAEQQPVRRPP
jgi:hypothetical protein